MSRNIAALLLGLLLVSCGGGESEEDAAIASRTPRGTEKAQAALDRFLDNPFISEAQAEQSRDMVWRACAALQEGGRLAGVRRSGVGCQRGERQNFGAPSKLPECALPPPWASPPTVPNTKARRRSCPGGGAGRTWLGAAKAIGLDGSPLTRASSSLGIGGPGQNSGGSGWGGEGRSGSGRAFDRGRPGRGTLPPAIS